MIYARGTGDGIAWNGGERGTGGRHGGGYSLKRETLKREMRKIAHAQSI